VRKFDEVQTYLLAKDAILCYFDQFPNGKGVWLPHGRPVFIFWPVRPLPCSLFWKALTGGFWN